MVTVGRRTRRKTGTDLATAEMKNDDEDNKGDELKSSDESDIVMAATKKIIAMFEYDRKKPINESLIDLNQLQTAEGMDTGAVGASSDVLMQLVAAYTRMTSRLRMDQDGTFIVSERKEEKKKKKRGRGGAKVKDEDDSANQHDAVLITAVEQFDTIIWPHVMALLEREDSEHKYLCKKDQLPSSAHSAFIRIFNDARTIRLHPHRSCMYQLAERLFLLGARTDEVWRLFLLDSVLNSTNSDNSNSHHTQPPIDAMLLLLRLAANVNVGQFMYDLVSNQRLGLLQQLYDRAPHIMLDVDYSSFVGSGQVWDSRRILELAERKLEELEVEWQLQDQSESESESDDGDEDAAAAEDSDADEDADADENEDADDADDDDDGEKEECWTRSGVSSSGEVWSQTVYASRDQIMEAANATTEEEREAMKATAREIVALLKKGRDKMMNLDNIIQTHRQMQMHNNTDTAAATAVQPRDDPPESAVHVDPGLDEKMTDVTDSHAENEDDDARMSQTKQHAHHASSAVSASHGQSQSERDDIDLLSRRVDRLAFTIRLLRNMHLWSINKNLETNMEYIGRVALMFVEEECNRPVEQSLIDLTQTDHRSREVVHVFFESYVRAVKYAKSDAIPSIIHTIIWPRLVEVIRHHRYDLTRTDNAGWCPLQLLLGYVNWPKDDIDAAKAKIIARKLELMESLLALGADPNQCGGGKEEGYRELDMQRNPPLIQLAKSGMVEMAGMEVLLRYGADPHATNTHGATFMHKLVLAQHVDAMRHFYTHHPALVFTFDYTRSSYDLTWDRNGGTLTHVAHVALQRAKGNVAKLRQDDASASEQVREYLQQSLQRAEGLFNLLESERLKQLNQFFEQLVQFTPMLPELAECVCEYVTPKNWQQLLRQVETSQEPSPLFG